MFYRGEGMLPYNVMDKASERLSTLRDESVELRFDEAEMHERLIEYESDFVYEDTIERPTLEIIDDTTIALNGIAMAVRGTDVSSSTLFVFRRVSRKRDPR